MLRKVYFWFFPYFFMALFSMLFAHQDKVLILCFHDISKKGRYSVDLDSFKKILNELDNHYTVLSLRDWHNAYLQKKRFRKPPVVLTFDDGYPTHFSQVIPLLREHKFGASFFIYTMLHRDHSSFYKRLSQLEEVFEVGGHSASHADLKLLNETDQVAFYKELYLSRKKLEYLTGKKVTSFAWPFGYYNLALVELAQQAGYSLQVSTDGVIATVESVLLPRVTIQQPNPLKQTIQVLKRYKKLF